MNHSKRQSWKSRTKLLVEDNDRVLTGGLTTSYQKCSQYVIMWERLMEGERKTTDARVHGSTPCRHAYKEQGEKGLEWDVTDVACTSLYHRALIVDL
jgi:hypothetical protein